MPDLITSVEEIDLNELSERGEWCEHWIICSIGKHKHLITV